MSSTFRNIRFHRDPSLFPLLYRNLLFPRFSSRALKSHHLSPINPLPCSSVCFLHCYPSTRLVSLSFSLGPRCARERERIERLERCKVDLSLRIGISVEVLCVVCFVSTVKKEDEASEILRNGSQLPSICTSFTLLNASAEQGFLEWLSYPFILNLALDLSRGRGVSGSLPFRLRRAPARSSTKSKGKGVEHGLSSSTHQPTTHYYTKTCRE